jgi:hypothetical protein
MARQTVLLVYGGESAESAASIRSARSVYAAMDGEKYDALLCFIDARGKWWLLERWTDNLDEHGGSQLVAALGSHSFLILPGNALIRPDVVVPLLSSSSENSAVVSLTQLLHIAVVGMTAETAAYAARLESVRAKLARKDIALAAGDAPKAVLMVALAGPAKEMIASSVVTVVDSEGPDDTLRSVTDVALAGAALSIAQGAYESLRCRSCALVTIHRTDYETLQLAAVDVYPELSTSGTFLKLWRMTGRHYPEVIDTIIATARK